MAVIVCPRCARKHKIDVSHLPAKKDAVVRCSGCRHKFSLDLCRLKVMAGEKPEIPKQKTGKQRAGFDKKQENVRKICVALNKGGVGKTTTSVNIAAGLAMAGFKVLLMDTDTQGQSAYMLDKKHHVGLTELLTGELTPEETIISARKNLWLLGGGKSLSELQRIINKKSFGAEWTMAEAMKIIEDQYDYIIIDTAPGWDQLMVNVLFFAEEVLIPVALEFMPFHGLTEFMKSLTSIQKYRKEVNLKYIVPTFMDARIDTPRKILIQLKKLYGGYLCKPIRYNENFSIAPSFGKTIYEFAPGCGGAEDYRELVRRVAGNNQLLT
ncbi:MAG: AAA family ATPase [Desulfobacteraceae bacterium]